MNITEIDEKQAARQFMFAMAGFIMVKLALTYIIYKATHND
jgi:hypothetical protein